MIKCKLKLSLSVIKLAQLLLLLFWLLLLLLLSLLLLLLLLSRLLLLKLLFDSRVQVFMNESNKSMLYIDTSFMWTITCDRMLFSNKSNLYMVLSFMGTVMCDRIILAISLIYMYF